MQTGIRQRVGSGTVRQHKRLAKTQSTAGITCRGQFPSLALEALLFVRLAKLKREAVDKSLRETSAVREVRSAFLISGPFDLVVHVVVTDVRSREARQTC
jgi:DNA-binding Lrp family transcriptional regulator